MRDIRDGRRWYALATEDARLGSAEPGERIDRRTGEKRIVPAFGLRKIAADLRAIAPGVAVFIGIQHFRVRGDNRARDRHERAAFGPLLLVEFEFATTRWEKLAAVDGARHFWPLGIELPVPLPHRDIGEVFKSQQMRDAELDDVIRAASRPKEPKFKGGEGVRLKVLGVDGEGYVDRATAERIWAWVSSLNGQPIAPRLVELAADDVEAA